MCGWLGFGYEGKEGTETSKLRGLRVCVRVQVNITKLIDKLKPMHKKADRLLRFQLWPQVIERYFALRKFGNTIQLPP